MTERMDGGETGAHFRVADQLLAIEGLAILRSAQRRELDSIADRRAEMEELISRSTEGLLSNRLDNPPVDLQQGYASWAGTYDMPEGIEDDPVQGNEGRVMRELIDGFPPGVVLDAGCGTGRHTAYLVEIGREVIGVDPSAEMLARAREKLPGVDFRQGDVTSLPLEDASVAAVVCGLVFSHLPEIGPAVDELARVLQPGGRAAISSPHPFNTGVLGRRAPVIDAQGNAWTMPEYEHLHGEYLDAFRRAGLDVLRCIEPPLTAANVRRWNPIREEGERNRFTEALEAALLGQPTVLVWEAAKGEAR